MEQTVDVKQRLLDLHLRSSAIAAEAEQNKRTMTQDEQKEFDACLREFDSLRRMNDVMGDWADETLGNGSGGRQIAPNPMANPMGPVRQAKKPVETADAPLAFRDEGSGQMVRALLPSERMADLPEAREETTSREDFSVGRCLHAILTGRIDKMSQGEQRAMLGSLDSGGGYMLSPMLSSQVVDLARSASVTLKAGAQTLPMPTGELLLTRISGDPTSTWRPEGVGVTASTVTLERITLRAKTLAAIVPVSIELLEDAANAPQIIEDALRASLAQQLDEMALVGTGASGQPLGIRNHAGVNANASVGTPTTYNEFSDSVGDILTANYTGMLNRLSWILHPRDGVTLDQLADSENQPLNPTPWVSQLQRFHTTALPTTEGGGSNESVSIIGAFNQLVLGLRTSGVVIEVLTAGSATDANSDSWNATDSLLRHIRAHLRADVVLLHPDWFSVLTGITA